MYGFENQITSGKNVTAQHEIGMSVPETMITVYYTKDEFLTYTFDKSHLFTSVELLCEYFETNIIHIFKEFKIVKNGLVMFSLQEDIRRITFENSLAMVLGLLKSIF